MTKTRDLANMVSGSNPLVDGVIDYSEITNTPAPFDPDTLAAVAVSGSYADLSNLPILTDITLDTIVINDSLILPAGTTAQRAISPINGNLRYNTTFGNMEIFSDTDWAPIVAPPTITLISPLICGVNTNTVFTVTGTFFKAGSIAKFVPVTGSSLNAKSTTVVSSTSITCVSPDNLDFLGAPYAIEIQLSSGASSRSGYIVAVDNPPIFSTPSGTIVTTPWNVPISYSIVAADPEGSSVTYSITSGALPVGVTLNTSTGLLSGTMSNQAATTYTFTVTATDTYLTASSRSFSIVVQNAAPVWVTASSLSDTGKNVLVSIPLTATDAEGAVLTYSIISGALPTGLTLVNNVIQGTIDSSVPYSTYSVVVEVTDGYNSASRNFTLPVVYSGVVPFEPSFASPSQTVTSSGTWTKPSGLRGGAMVWVYIVGGGAGGNSSYYFGGDSSWGFGGRGAAATIFITDAQTLDGASYQIGASTIGSGWQSGQRSDTSLTMLDGTSFNSYQYNCFSHNLTGVEGYVSGSYFEVSGAQAAILLKSGDRDGAFGSGSQGADTGSYGISPIFGAGGGSGTYGGGWPRTTSQFAGHGGQGGPGQFPGGGGAPFQYGAAGRISFYYGT